MATTQWMTVKEAAELANVVKAQGGKKVGCTLVWAAIWRSDKMEVKFGSRSANNHVLVSIENR